MPPELEENPLDKAIQEGVEDPTQDENHLNLSQFNAQFANQKPLVKPIPEAPPIQPVQPLDKQQDFSGISGADPINSSRFAGMSNGGTSVPPGNRQFIDQQNALAPVADPKSPSRTKGGAIGAIAGKTGIPTSTEDLTKAVGQKVLGRAAETKVGKAALEVADAAQRVGKLFATGGADLGSWWALLVKYKKPILTILLVMELPFVLVAVAIASSFGSVGDPVGGVGVASNAVFAGAHCEGIMQPSLTTTYQGKGITLTLSSTQSGYSEEDPVIPSGPSAGHVNNTVGHDGISSGQITFWSYYESQHAAGKFPEEWLPYYITSRWPYIGWAWSGAASRSPFKAGSLAAASAFAGKRLVIYNPKTGKAVLGIAMEAGNAPYAAAYDKLGTNSSDQESAWKAGSNAGYRIQDPTTYKGRSIGGPYPMDPKSGGPSIETALGITPGSGSDVPVTFGFAPESMQNQAPGPINCNAVTGISGTANTTSGVTTTSGVQNDSAVSNDGVPHFVPNVPAVRQADGNDCNKASAAMVVLHYDPQASGFTTNDGKHQVINSGSGTCYSSTANALAKGLSSKGITFSELQPSKVSISLFKQSIDNGDPVIVSTHNITSGPNGHFVVIVGYDNSNFYINDPFPWQGSDGDLSQGTVHIYTNHGHTPSHNLLTQTALMGALYGGNTGGGYVAIIRNR